MAFFKGDIYRSKETEEIDMTLEQFYRYQEESFDAFCKKVIRNAASSVHRKLDEKADREPSLSDISEAELNHLHTVDVYQTYCKTFPVRDIWSRCSILT